MKAVMKRKLEKYAHGVAMSGLALAAARNHDYDRAEQLLRKLIKRHPDEHWYQLALAEVFQQQEHHGDAIRQLDALIELMPGNYAATVMLAYSYIRKGEPEKAEQLLDPLLLKRPDDAPLWRLAADAYGKNGKLGEAHLARGEYLFLNGDEEGAKEQLRYALKESKQSFPLHSQIKARLKEMDQLSEEDF